MSQIRAKQIRSNATGDLLVGDNTNFEILPVGLLGQVLTVSGSNVSWESPTVPSAFVYRGTVDASLPLLPQVSVTHAYLTPQDVTYTAVATGPGGNAISLAYTTGGVAGSEVVTVVGNAITVQIQSGASTAAQIATAIANSVAAAALVTAVANTPAAFQTAPLAITYFAGGRTLEAGDFYVVIATGNTENFAGTWDANAAAPYVGAVFLDGDSIVFDGAKWDKFDNHEAVVAGTANEIDVSYAPLTETYTVSMSNTYAGSTSITTLGTITSGTWNGAPIARQFGGSGNDTTSLTANQIFVATSSTTTGGIQAPTSTGTFLEWNGSAFVWTAAPTTGYTTVAGNSGSVTSTGVAQTLNVVGTLGIVTAAASGSPDTVTVSTSIASGSALYNDVGVASEQLGIRGATAGTLLQATGLTTEAVWSAFTLPTVAGGAGTFLISNGTNIINSTLTLPNTATAPGALVVNSANTVTDAIASTAGQVLRYDGASVAFGTVEYADLSGTPIFASDEFIVVTAGANLSIPNFFTTAPIATSVIVFFNGLRLQNTGYTVSGTTLALIDSVNGYQTDVGDQITSNYSHL
jgi:hypothetical protein